MARERRQPKKRGRPIGSGDSDARLAARKADSLRKPKPLPPPALKRPRFRLSPRKVEDYCRNLIPGYDPWRDANGYQFSANLAREECKWFHDELTHVKGDTAGEPFTLEPWEVALVGNIFGWLDKAGNRRYREVLLYIPRKNGKALDIDTPIPTPDGWSSMGALQEGDWVFDDQGLPTRILAAHPAMYGHRCYSVEFSDHTSIIADEDHLWATKICESNATRMRTTREIADTLFRCESKNERRHSIALCGPLLCDKAELPIDPYALGIWLGDGDSDAARITLHEDDRVILWNLEQNGVTIGKTHHDARRPSTIRVCIGSHPPSPGKDRTSSQKPCIHKHLRTMGLLGNKHVPNKYLRAGTSQRVALLQGLMDSDGYVSKAGQCEFTTVSARLRDNFLELTRSLGLKPTFFIGKATCNGHSNGPSYRVQFWPTDDVCPFQLPRKVRGICGQRGNGRSHNRKIVAVIPVKSRPVRCIRVESPSGLFLAGKGMVPTHNTPVGAGLIDRTLFKDREPGAEIYGVADSYGRARFVFEHAAGMVKRNPKLLERAQIFKGMSKAIQLRDHPENIDDLSVYRLISGESDVGHGQNIHVVVVDELHLQSDRELVDSLSTATASKGRRQPLIVYLTTADYMHPSICNEIYEYACRVRDGLCNPRFLPMIYEASSDDDWTDEKVWERVNPNLDVSVSREYLRSECQKAIDAPANENRFKRLHLNIRTEQDVRFISMDKWDACGEIEVDSEALKGNPCWCGLDLAATSDTTAFAAIFPDGEGGFKVLTRFWLPEVTARKRSRQDRVPYEQWIRDGLIVATEGDVTDYAVVRRDINAFADEHGIQELAIDRLFQGAQLATELQQDGLEVVSFGQGFLSMTAPTVRLDELIRACKLYHGGNPVLRWMASNVSVELDAAGNIKPSRKKSTEKIDGIVAVIMALGRATCGKEDGSHYDTHDLLVI